MKKIVIILTVFLVVFVSCDDDNKNTLEITQGIMGLVKYGEGDCMPEIDESKRIYKNYNGFLYFIVKSDLEELGNGDFEKLKAKSIKTKVTDGKFKVELPIGVFLAMPTDVYLFSDYNTLEVKKGIVLKKNFSFWKCTSY